MWRHRLGTRPNLIRMTVIISCRLLAWMWSVPTHIMLEYCRGNFFFGPARWKRLRYFLNSKGLFSEDDFYDRFWGWRIPKLDRLRDTRVRMSEHRNIYYTYVHIHIRTYVRTYIHTYIHTIPTHLVSPNLGNVISYQSDKSLLLETLQKSCNIVLLLNDKMKGALCLIKHQAFNPYGGVEE